MTAPERRRRRRERTGWIPRVQYIPSGSPLHRLHPLPKLATLLGATVAVFIVDETWQLLLFLAVLLALFPAARLSLWEFRAGARFFISFSVLLMAIHAFFVHEGEVLLDATMGPFRTTVTQGGLVLGLHMVIRFLVVVLGSFLFVATTEPNALAHGLMAAGLPYRAGFAMVLAMRLMPLLRSESSTVREAQAARGMPLDRPGLRGILRSIRHTFTPLLVSSLSRVDYMVISMEGRGFGLHPKRTFLREVPWRVRDSVLMTAGVALPLVAAVARWWWP